MPINVLTGLDGCQVVLVASYGRAGSSRLMQLIKLTGAAAVAGHFPYETRSVQFGILSATGAGIVAADGSMEFDSFPYRSPTIRYDTETVEQFRRRIIQELVYLWPYALEPAPVPGTALAEKAAGLKIVAHTLAAVPNSAAVFLDRDPRDVFLSILDFNKRRQTVSFGAERGTTVLAQRIAEYYLSAATLICRHQDRISVVDYRSMVRDPLTAVQDALKTPVLPVTVSDDELTSVSNPEHVTAPEGFGSVDRWLSVRDRWKAEFAILTAAHRSFRGMVPPGWRRA